jgi:predicted TIM-barrel fold metal-dependent hydrolase
MFASNFPVDSVLASFDEIFDGFKDVTSEMNNNETTHLFYQNAVKYYNPA